MSEIGFFPHARTQVPTTGWAAGAWNRDVDISAIPGVTIPAGATTVAIQVFIGSTGYSSGVQSSDDTADIVRATTNNSACNLFVPLNASKTLDFYPGSLTGVTFWIVGFSNAIEMVSPLDVSGQVAAINTDTTITASNISSSEAAFALVEVFSANNVANKVYPVGGYSAAPAGRLSEVNHIVVPINASKQFGAYFAGLPDAGTLRVIGWIRSQHYHYVAAPVGHRPVAISVYEDFPETVPSSAKYACFTPVGGYNTHAVDIRAKGSALSISPNPDHARWASPDASGAFEFKITLNNDLLKFALRGWFVNQAGVTITGTDDDTPEYQSSLTISGTGFGATQGTGAVTIGGVSQTVTSWADTSIAVTVARGSNRYGVALDLVVTDGSGAASTAYSVTLMPQAGWDYVVIGTPDTTADNSLDATPALAAGKIVPWDTNGGTVVVLDDGTYTASVAEFDFEVWSSADGYSATNTQIVGGNPALTSPTATQASYTSIRWGVTTDTTGASLYVYVSGNATETASTIKASGTPQAVTTAGVQSGTITGLTFGNTYYVHFAQDGDTDTTVASSGSVKLSTAASLTLVDGAGSPLASTELRAWARASIGDAAVNGGAGGFVVSTNASGVLALTGLTVPAGAGVVTLQDPLDPVNSHNYPVTFA